MGSKTSKLTPDQIQISKNHPKLGSFVIAKGAWWGKRHPLDYRP